MSRKTRNWTIVLILIPVVAYGAARLAIWYSVKDSFDDTRRALSPVAALEYSKILSPVFGAFGITGLSVEPHVFEDRISVGSALVHIDDPTEKYRFLKARMDETIPTSFKFSLNGVRIPLNGDIAKWLDRTLAVSRAGAGTPRGCAPGSVLTMADVRKMGYDELVANLALDYGYDRGGGGLVTYAKIDVQDMFELVVEGRIPPSDVVFDVNRMRGVPRLSDLTLSIRDLSWSSRRNKYCADATGVTEARYMQARLDQTRKAMAGSGFEPSDELMAALKKFAAGTAQLTLSMNPRDPIKPSEVNFRNDPEYMIDRLGLEVMVDGKPVPELGTVRKAEPETTEVRQKPEDETYKPTPVLQLPRYLKSHVQIFTVDGKIHEGYLDSVGARKIVLTRHLVGGSVTFDVSRSDVNRVLVLRP